MIHKININSISKLFKFHLEFAETVYIFSMLSFYEKNMIYDLY